MIICDVCGKRIADDAQTGSGQVVICAGWRHHGQESDTSQLRACSHDCWTKIRTAIAGAVHAILNPPEPENK